MSIFKGRCIWVDVENRYYIVNIETKQGYPLHPKNEVVQLDFETIYDCQIIDYVYLLQDVQLSYPCAKIIPPENHLISDDEIIIAMQKAWSDYEYQEGNLYSTTFRDGWIMCAKWMREQLKKKQ